MFFSTVVAGATVDVSLRPIEAFATSGTRLETTKVESEVLSTVQTIQLSKTDLAMIMTMTSLTWAKLYPETIKEIRGILIRVLKEDEEVMDKWRKYSEKHIIQGWVTFLG